MKMGEDAEGEAEGPRETSTMRRSLTTTRRKPILFADTPFTRPDEDEHECQPEDIDNDDESSIASFDSQAMDLDADRDSMDMNADYLKN